MRGHDRCLNCDPSAESGQIGLPVIVERSPGGRLARRLTDHYNELPDIAAGGAALGPCASRNSDRKERED